ncbi:hypothetical protein F0562_019493 [Nyssa sinensis]|uniref:CNH domain-containing protein n=1 Tax=Nyssa sinensis TaxID=561372 RepID=A0A5J5BRH8_9ASTE|nr:hypothetical protein F0562_019493 [Nyssa sinensis]
MAKLEQNTRTVLEPFAEFNPSSSSVSPFRSMAISTVSDSQTLIYVGTESGNLLLLSLNPNSTISSNIRTHKNSTDLDDSKPKSISFLRYVSISDSLVSSIHLIVHIGKVLVVSDGFIFLVDSLLLQPVKKLSFLKGVSLVARRFRSAELESTNLVGDGSTSLSEFSSTGQRFLQKLGGGIRSNGVKIKESELHRDNNSIFSIVAGKRLVLVEFVLGGRVGRSDRDIDSTGGSFVILKEIQCLEGVKTMVWLDDSIIVGTLNGYSLYSCVTGQSTLIFSLPDPSSPPCLKLLLKEYKVLLVVDNVGVICNAQGQPVGGSLVFRRPPDSIGEISSCVVVVRNGKMELYHKKSGDCIQIVSFAGEGVGSCVVADEVDGSGKLVAVATPSKVICYQKVPCEEQIKDLLRKKNYKEAISLVEELHETMQPSELFPFIMRDPNRWSLLVPRNRFWGLHPPPAPLENVVDDGLMAIQRAIFLKKAGVETSVDNDFLVNPPRRADLLESAIKNIIRYLQVSCRKDLTPPVREGVDTLLIYLYRALNLVDDMERLASSENSCIVEELETLLNDSGHLRTLAFLYASKGMSSKALAIWRILARNYSSGYREETAGQNDLHDAFRNVVSGKETAAIEASKILEESSDQELVLQHLGWIADINQVLAVQILTSEKRTDQLSPDEVIAAIDPKKVEILQRYLQWLIEDQDSDDTQFHTSYALLLAKSAIETKPTCPNSEAGTLEEANIFDCGRNSIFQSPVRERLQNFLVLSDLYDPEEVLDLIEGSELWLEKSILYQKLGQETLVLQILALKLGDSVAAEKYCGEIGRPDAYMQLLEMYLDPKDGKEPMFNAAVRLLHNHGESLDPLQVLEVSGGLAAGASSIRHGQDQEDENGAKLQSLAGKHWPEEEPSLFVLTSSLHRHTHKSSQIWISPFRFAVAFSSWHRCRRLQPSSLLSVHTVIANGLRRCWFTVTALPSFFNRCFSSSQTENRSSDLSSLHSAVRNLKAPSIVVCHNQIWNSYL